MTRTTTRNIKPMDDVRQLQDALWIACLLLERGQKRNLYKLMRFVYRVAGDRKRPGEVVYLKTSRTPTP